MLSHDEQSIIAQCSPKGAGALAILRLTGSDAIAIADRISHFSGNKTLATQSSHTIHYGKVIDAKKNGIDTVIFLLMHGPKTFTGQDTVEITCHNNPFIIEAIINRAIETGARIAQPGEFTRRAVINNKMDLIQAEAINDLIHANSQEGLKRSLSQLEGSLSHAIHSIEQKLVQALALSEASFEFLDEEDLEFHKQIETILQEIMDKISHIRSSFEQQKQIRQGVRIALIGSVNAGKSSLFNRLFGSNRAIVTSQAGTTRDVIEAGLYRDGLYWTIIDTAGLRQADDHIEKEGIKRSYQEAEKADIILLIKDSSRPLSQEEIAIYSEIEQRHLSKIISLYSKADMVFKGFIPDPQSLHISVHDSHSTDQLTEKIQAKIKALFETDGSNYLLTQRQNSLLIRLENKLQEVQSLIQSDCQYELVSHQLNDALSDLSELTGKTISEAAMDAVFREFCVGK